MGGMKDETEAIAGKVRAVAAEFGLTQQGVADVLGLERKAVVARWHGRVAYSGAELSVLARHLDIPVSTFFASRRQQAATPAVVGAGVVERPRRGIREPAGRRAQETAPHHVMKKAPAATGAKAERS